MAIDEGITLKKVEVFLSFMQFGNLARVAEAQRQRCATNIANRSPRGTRRCAQQGAIQ